MPRNATPRDKSPKRTSALVPHGPMEPFPTKLAPMLATPFEEPFTRSGWLHEPKLDGYRALAFVVGGKVTLRSRRNLDLTTAFPDVAADLATQPEQQLVLDGEIVVFEDGRPSFNALQNRAQLKLKRQIAETQRRMPAIFYVFDILHVDGINVRGSTYEERHRYLGQCVHPQTHVQLVHAEADGIALYEACVAMGLEGTIAKRAESTYESGTRSGAWLKMKAMQSGEFVIGGFTTGEGARGASDSFGSLLVGYWQDEKLRYAGNVGTGFTDRTLAQIRERLTPLVASKRPFETMPDSRRPVIWVRPEVVAEVRYYAWTPAGLLRHPIFLRIRNDLDAHAVIVRPNG
jgi:bifunctional non-homologous end joining protein LigD